jgi:hypothetical protein
VDSGVNCEMENTRLPTSIKLQEKNSKKIKTNIYSYLHLELLKKAVPTVRYIASNHKMIKTTVRQFRHKYHARLIAYSVLVTSAPFVKECSIKNEIQLSKILYAYVQTGAFGETCVTEHLCYCTQYYNRIF